MDLKRLINYIKRLSIEKGRVDDDLKVLVTGGLGFVGSHLVDALIMRGYQVVVLDNLSSGFGENQNLDALTIIGDVRSTDDLADAGRYGLSTIFHLAEYIPNTVGHVIQSSM